MCVAVEIRLVRDTQQRSWTSVHVHVQVRRHTVACLTIRSWRNLIHTYLHTYITLQKQIDTQQLPPTQARSAGLDSTVNPSTRYSVVLVELTCPARTIVTLTRFNTARVKDSHGRMVYGIRMYLCMGLCAHFPFSPAQRSIVLSLCALCGFFSPPGQAHPPIIYAMRHLAIPAADGTPP